MATYGYADSLIDSYLAWPNAGAFPLQYFVPDGVNTLNTARAPEYPWTVKLGSLYSTPEKSNVILTLTVQCTSRVAGLKLPSVRAYSGFNDDAGVSGYAKNAVEMLYKAGIINGKSDNIFYPQGNATRAEVAAMLHRFISSVQAV